jgi:uncharacterized membrane protein
MSLSFDKGGLGLQSSRAFFFSEKAMWFHGTLLIILATVLIIFLVPEQIYPLAYIRVIFGLLFIAWLPGFTFMKALFPASSDFGSKNIDGIIMAALSLGISIAFTPLIGLLLNYTPWGIKLASITLSLATLTLLFATVGILREYTQASFNCKPD